MDTRKWEALLRAADEGSLLQAGERLGYTQSGLTQMMNSLEREVGFPLLIRGNKGVRLSEEGRQLAPLVRELVLLQERITQESARILGLETGNVHIGSFSSMSIHWVPGILAQFRSQYPHIHAELLETGSADELESWLQEGRVDLCFYSLPESSPYDQIPLQQDPLYAVLPKGHPLEGCKEFAIEQVRGKPFLMYKSSSGYDRDVHLTLKRAGIKPDIRYSSNSDAAIVSMVAHGLGISILPQLILKDHMDKVVAMPISPPAHRNLGIAVRAEKELSPAAQRFIACAKQLVPTL